MKKIVTALILVGASVGLVACGGGDGDSSSGGGSSSQYTGTYKGTELITVNGFGQTATESFPVTITVANDGKIDAVSDGLVSSAQCSESTPIYLNGSSYSANVSATCNDPQLGKCTISGTESGSVNDSGMSGTGSVTMNCSVGTFTAKMSFTATKMDTSQSFSAQSVGGTKSGNSIFSSAIGTMSRNR